MSDQPLNAPVPNLPLLRKVLDHIDAHPEEWRQDDFAVQVVGENYCGTAFCIAGHALVMSGYQTRPNDFHPNELDFIDANGKRVEPDDAARELLGLTVREADLYGGLFDGGNTRGDVQRIAESIAERGGERL